MTNKLIYRLLTFLILASIFTSATNARAASVASAQNVSKATVKAPAAAPVEDDANVVKIDDKAKPAPTPKPKPKPGPRDDGDGD